MAHERQAHRRQADIRAALDRKAEQLRAHGLTDSEPLRSVYLADTREDCGDDSPPT